MTARLRDLVVLPLLGMLTACGDNNDTLWTGLSGVILFGIIAVIVLHFLRK